jgi:hypothetical protein
MIPGSVNSSFSSWRCHEELNKGRYSMLQCWEGSEAAVLSESVDETW